MGRISRTEDNMFDLPKGAFLRNGVYVYVNTSNRYISAANRKNGGKGYTGPDSVCIGVLVDKNNMNEKKFFANETYKELYLKSELPEPPVFADSIAVGFNDWLSQFAELSGLIEDLNSVFDVADSRLILDLASYMISRESAVMQHFPAWAREHMIFSEEIRNDTQIGKFLKNDVTVSKINLFRDLWFKRNIGEGKIYLCYDSTNVNCQARGVSIVQMGYAKDDDTLPQVNTDYVVRQQDGLPLTYLHSPGSVTDIAQAQEMIDFINKGKKLTGKELNICMICDRGYISEKNVRMMDNFGISYLLMLRTNFCLYRDLTDETIDQIKTYKNELNCDEGEELYGITRECTLYENGPECYAQIIWSNNKYLSNRREIGRIIEAERRRIEKFIEENKGNFINEKDVPKFPCYFKLKTEQGTPQKEERQKRGRGNSTKTVETPTLRILGYDDIESEINREYQKGGIIILVTKDKLTVQETINEYNKRDCVEKVFEALKSHMGMDKIGVATENAMHGKGFIWFVASIIHASLFIGTKSLRTSDKKRYTVPAMVDQLEAIKADKDLKTGKYKRRYKITKIQNNILKQWKIDENHIDDRIKLLG